MKLVYQIGIDRRPVAEACASFEEYAAAAPAAREFALALAEGVEGRRAEVEEALTAALKTWTMDRLSAIDAALLRVATYELLFREDIPARATLDEAIELSREYSSGESAGFVNGVLDAVARARAPHKL
jgi:N utilization substance protein B